jgi:hypothetical protein
MFWKLYVLELLSCVQLRFLTLRHVTFTLCCLDYVATSAKAQLTKLASTLDLKCCNIFSLYAFRFHLYSHFVYPFVLPISNLTCKQVESGAILISCPSMTGFELIRWTISWTVKCMNPVLKCETSEKSSLATFLSVSYSERTHHVHIVHGPHQPERNIA